jgi:hypothetical protein
MDYILQVWFLLIPIAVVLIMLRDDFNLIAKDVNSAVRSGVLGILSLLIITIVLPVTIPYSISNIINKLK